MCVPHVDHGTTTGNMSTNERSYATPPVRWFQFQQASLALVFLVNVLCQGSPAFGASEQFYSQHPAPKSVEEIHQPMEAHFIQREKPESLFDVWEREGKVSRFPAWLSNQSLHFKTRTYYLLEDHKDDSTSEAWALGNWLDYDTGWLFDRVALGASLYTSQKLLGPADRDGTKLLLSGQESFAVLGQAYGRVRVAEDHQLVLFRQKYDLPYLNKDDSRMAPITFEAYSLTGYFGKHAGFPSLHYIAGYVSQIKLKDSNRFVNMAKAAGVDGPNRGMVMEGMRFALTKDLNLGVINYTVPDTLNILYSEGNMTFRPTHEVAITTQLQFTYQSSLGDDLLTGTDFDTYQVAGELVGNYRNGILRVAFSTTTSDADIQSPYGGSPSPLSIMLNDFDRAGEDAWLIGLSYNFKDVGLEELSGFVNFAQGFGARNNPNEEELDITLDYRFTKGPLHHWWLRLRNAFGNEINGDKTENQVRVILNYDLPIF